MISPSSSRLSLDVRVEECMDFIFTSSESSTGVAEVEDGAGRSAKGSEDDDVTFAGSVVKLRALCERAPGAEEVSVQHITRYGMPGKIYIASGLAGGA